MVVGGGGVYDSRGGGHSGWRVCLTRPPLSSSLWGALEERGQQVTFDREAVGRLRRRKSRSDCVPGVLEVHLPMENPLTSQDNTS